MGIAGSDEDDVSPVEEAEEEPEEEEEKKAEEDAKKPEAGAEEKKKAEAGEEYVGSKRKHEKRAAEQRAEEHRLRRCRKAKFDSYYSGSFYGKSCAFLMYSISQQLNKENVELLWYFIVGTTYQYICSRMSKLQYDEMNVEMQREVMRLCKQKDAPKMTQEVIDEEGKDKTIQSSNFQVGTIVWHQEYVQRLYPRIDCASCCSATGPSTIVRITRATSPPSCRYGRYAYCGTQKRIGAGKAGTEQVLCEGGDIAGGGEAAVQAHEGWGQCFIS